MVPLRLRRLPRLAAATALVAFVLYCGSRAALPPGPRVPPGLPAEDADALRRLAADRPRVLTAFRALKPDGLPDDARLAAAGRAARGETADPDFVLLALADEPELCPTPADRDAFLFAHAAHVALLRSADPTGAAAEKYAAALQFSATDPVAWKVTRDDPAAVALRAGVPDLPAEDFAYYAANRDWLGDLLPLVGPNPKAPAATPEAVVKDVLAACRRYHPLPQRAAAQFGPAGVVPFLSAGDAVAGAHGRGVPLNEAVEVAFADPDLGADGPGIAVTMASAYVSARPVWEAAKSSPRLLWLYARLPDRAAAIVARYPGGEVPALLAASYADALLPAVEALDRAPLVALDVLAAAAADPDGLRPFQKALVSLGWRVVPYAAAYGIPAAAGVTRPWLDKAFHADGRPREKEWWTAVPLVGGPADLVRNAANGTVDVADVGWAALDVADGVLLAATLGGSAGLTAAKQAAKAGTRVGLRLALAGPGRVAVRALAAAKPLGSRLVRAVGGGVVGRYAVRPGARVAVAAFRALRAGTAALPAPRAHVLARGMLAVGLAVTLQYRTVPAMAAWYERQLAEGMPALTAAAAVAQTVVDVTNAASKLGREVPRVSDERATWAGGGAAAALAMAWWRLIRRRPAGAGVA